MSLKPCRECKKDVSSEAKTCPHCGVSKPTKGPYDISAGMGCLLVFGLLMLIGFIGSLGDTPSTPAPTESTGVGSDVVLSVNSGKVVVCPTEAAYTEFGKLSAAKDYLGMAKMEAEGRLFTVTSGTKARVISRGFEKREVRIMEGPHFGKSGWVTASLVR